MAVAANMAIMWLADISIPVNGTAVPCLSAFTLPKLSGKKLVAPSALDLMIEVAPFERPELLS